MFFFIFGYLSLSTMSGHTKDGSHQYITIPISMTQGALSQSQQAAASTNKQNAKDTAKHTNSRESPPNQEVTIKKECAE